MIVLNPWSIRQSLAAAHGGQTIGMPGIYFHGLAAVLVAAKTADALSAARQQLPQRLSSAAVVPQQELLAPVCARSAA